MEKILLPDDMEMLSTAMAKICDEGTADLSLQQAVQVFPHVM